MLCGGYTKIWPEPTKSYIGTSANSFSLMNVQYKIKTPFKSVENLLENAFSVFMDELHKIFHSSSTSASDEGSTSSSSSTTRLYKDERQSQLEFASTHGSKKHNNNHSTVNIFLFVLKTADIHLTLSTDECYNLTLTRKLITN
jgi:beta-acetyl hexosaminidase like